MNYSSQLTLLPTIAPTPNTSSHDPAGGTSNDDEYNTPQWLWQPGLKVFGLEKYDLDVATNNNSTVPAAEKFTIDDNSLSQSWQRRKNGKTKLWMNPPFSENLPFALKLIDEWQWGHIEAIVLDKHDHRVAWWGLLADAATEVLLVRGYVRFDGQTASYRFPVAMFYFGSEPQKFREEYGGLGWFLKTGRDKET